MTKEQIAGARLFPGDGTDALQGGWALGLGRPHLEVATIVRLLDEREALLLALKHITDRVQQRPDHDWCRGVLDECHGEHAPCGDAVALTESVAAIAKAEAP